VGGGGGGGGGGVGWGDLATITKPSLKGEVREDSGGGGKGILVDRKY